MDVEFTDYARMRMHQRDILDEEVVQALESPSGRHTARKDDRYEVTRRTGTRSLLVVYRRQASKVIVINAMWEN